MKQANEMAYGLFLPQFHPAGQISNDILFVALVILGIGQVVSA